ncbi:hypothetical protein HY312_02090 [Candidatus Saccharibacteria bacterium]|nr:hypothetical protein [Candidatus Saccharibacteria bacterium]
MSNPESIQSTPENRSDTAELESLNNERREVLRESLDKAELQHKQDKQEALADVRSEALNNAKDADPHAASHSERSPAERRTGFISRSQREQSFAKQMDGITPHLSSNEKKLSNFIHKKGVEKASDTASSTIARPNALLAGSIAAFLLVTIVYLLAKHYGYRLSGFETIGAFALGWILGMVYDYIRLLIGNKKQ